jgi:MoaA/NifB/PqqE/SkfB family radical SAM enzyme
VLFRSWFEIDHRLEVEPADESTREDAPEQSDHELSRLTAGALPAATPPTSGANPPPPPHPPPPGDAGALERPSSPPPPPHPPPPGKILIEAVGSNDCPSGEATWGHDLKVCTFVRVPVSANQPSLRLELEHVTSGYIVIASFAAPLGHGCQRVTLLSPRFPLVGDYRILARLVEGSGVTVASQAASLKVRDSRAGLACTHDVIRLPHEWSSKLSGFSSDDGPLASPGPVRPRDVGGGAPLDVAPVVSATGGEPGALKVLFEPLKIDIAIIQRCNFRCVMCECWKSDDSRDVPAERWSDMLRRARDCTRLKLVCIGGGEPLLKEDVLDVVRTCSALDLFSVMVSNGSLISEERARAIVEAGLDVLSVSIDGFAPTHDALRGVPGAFDRAVRAASRVRDCGGKTRCGASAFICEQNLDEVIRLAEFVNETPFFDGINFQALQQVTSYRGADWYRASPLWPKDAGRVAAVIDELISRKRQGLNIHNPEQQLRNFAAFYRDPTGASFRMLCKAGYSALPLDARGDVHLCPKVPSIGNIFEVPFTELYLGEAASAVRRMSRTCEEKCHFLVNCYEEHRENR